MISRVRAVGRGLVYIPDSQHVGGDPSDNDFTWSV